MLNSGNNFSSGPRLLSAGPRLSRRITSFPDGKEEGGEGGEGEEGRKRGTEMAGSVSASGRFTEARRPLLVPAAEPVTSFNEC